MHSLAHEIRIYEDGGAAGRSSCTRRASTNVAAAGTSAFTRTARLCSRDAASSLVNRWKGIFNLPLSIRKTVKRSSTTLTSLATGRIRFIIPRRPNDCPQIPSRLRWLGECRLGYLKRRPLGVPVNYSSNDFVRSCAAIIRVVLGSRAPREMTLACIRRHVCRPVRAATFVQTVRMNSSHEAPCVRHYRFLCADPFRQPPRGCCRHLV